MSCGKNAGPFYEMMFKRNWDNMEENVMEQNHEKSPKCVNTTELMESIAKPEKDVCIFDDKKFDEIMQEDLQIKVNKIVDWIDKQIQDRKFDKVNGRIEIADTDELSKECGLLEDYVLYEVRRVFALRNLVFQFIEYEFKVGYKFIFQKALKDDDE